MLSPGGFQFAWCIWFTIHSLCYVMSIYYDYCIYIYTYKCLYLHIIISNILHLKPFLTPFGEKKALRLLWHCGNSAQGRVETLQARRSRWKVGRFTSDLPHLSNAWKADGAHCVSWFKVNILETGKLSTFRGKKEKDLRKWMVSASANCFFLLKNGGCFLASIVGGYHFVNFCGRFWAPTASAPC